MQLTRIRVYPVKSLAGTDVESARVNPWGLEDDRRWAIVDAGGTKVTAREVNGLLGLTAVGHADGVRLSDRACSTLDVAFPSDGDAVAVTHKRQGTASAACAEADAWLTERMGGPLRLVWQPDPTARPIDPALGGLPGDTMTLADGAPLLLVNEASLDRLDGWLDTADRPLDVVRFRPNVVVDGLEAFAEDTWPFVTIGAVRFRTTMVCDRCVMTTIDPGTLERGSEPIRTLAKHRRWEGSTWFGTRLAPLDTGTIRVGDAVAPEW